MDAVDISARRLEWIYERLAESIDAAGPEGEKGFLVRLSFTLAAELNDPARFERAVRAALPDGASVDAS